MFHNAGCDVHVRKSELLWPPQFRLPTLVLMARYENDRDPADLSVCAIKLDLRLLSERRIIRYPKSEGRNVVSDIAES